MAGWASVDPDAGVHGPARASQCGLLTIHPIQGRLRRVSFGAGFPSLGSNLQGGGCKERGHLFSPQRLARPLPA